jgi:hypothetical protein
VTHAIFKAKTFSYGRNNRNPIRGWIFGMDWYDPTCYASEILDEKYEKVLVDDVIDQLNHLSAQQKNDLKQVLMSILNYLMALWEFILTGSSTLI